MRFLGFPQKRNVYSVIRANKRRNMTDFEQYCVVLELAISLKENGSWAGETHIQKAGYFLSSLMNVPLGVHFILYKHGPFSFELREMLTEMEAQGFINWKPMPPYGPTIEIGELGDALRNGFGSLARQYQSQIGFVAKHLGSRNVASLERVATALFVTKEGYSGSSRVGRIRELKPHVDVSLAEQAVKDYDDIAELASSSRLVN
jgi:uncharacterized protein YwgA